MRNLCAAVLAGCLIFFTAAVLHQPQRRCFPPTTATAAKAENAKIENAPLQLQGAQARGYLEKTEDGRSLAQAVTAARFGLKWQERSPFGDEGGGYLGMSHVQNLNAWFDTEGMTIRPTLPEEERDKAWRFGMRLKAYGYGAQLTDAPPIVSQKVKENRIEYERANCQSPIANCRFENIASGGALSVLKSAIGNRQSSMTEWYENRAAGIEQGFTLNSPPGRASSAANEPLRLTLKLEGDLHARAKGAGGEVQLFKQDGDAVLSYGQLLAKDSKGRLLPSRMETNSDGSEIALLVQDAGATYPIDIDPITATLEQKLTKFHTETGAEFGDAVAISGNLAVIGAFLDDHNGNVDTGRVYFFARSGSTPPWSYIFIDDPIDSPSAQCGWSVAISEDSRRVAIGCPGTNANTGFAELLQSFDNWTTIGSVNLFPEFFPTFSMLSPGDRYGESVALGHGDVFVGAPFAEDIDNNSIPSVGVIYAFVVSASLNVDHMAFSSGRFLSETILGKPTVADSRLGTSLGATDGSQEGNQINKVIIGIPGGGSLVGSAHIFFSRPDAHAFYTSAEGALSPNDGSPGDLFGYSVAISGNTAVVGAPLNDNANGKDAGAVYVFVHSSNSAPDSGPWILQQKLIASDGIENDQFGQSVAIEGNTIVVGSPYNGSKTFLGTRGNGRTYVFMRNINVWSEQTTISALFDGAPVDKFGIAVAFSGDTVISGAEHAEPGGITNAGAAYVHRLSCVPPYRSEAVAAVSGMPRTGSICPGGSVSLDILATNQTSLRYQWRKNGTNIPGATASRLTINNASASDAGSYDAIVTDSCGGEISRPFTLGVFSFAVFPATQNIGYAGNTGLLAINATGPCPWTAQSNASWITVTSGTSGTGNGNVGFRVDPNPGTSQRTGTMTVAGQTVTFNQDGSPPPSGPTIFVAQGTNLLAAVDSVTFVRGPFTLTDDHNFSSDHRTRIIFFTTDLGFAQPSQPNVSILSVEVGGFSVPVERVGPFSFPGVSGSYIVVRLPDLPTGDWPLSIRLNGMNSSNSPTLTIRAGP